MVSPEPGRAVQVSVCIHVLVVYTLQSLHSMCLQYVTRSWVVTYGMHIRFERCAQSLSTSASVLSLVCATQRLHSS